MYGFLFVILSLICIISLKFNNNWSSIPRIWTRFIICSIIFIDACLGLLFSEGFINLINLIVDNKLPEEKGLIWLLQFFQATSAAFGYVKIIFDDFPKNSLRTVSMILSPIFLISVILIICDFLLIGRETTAVANLDFVQITTSTFKWSATYLSIAVALTLTYKVQRYGNFAQSEFFMLGMYIAMAIIWTDYFLPTTIAPADGVLVWSALIYTLIAAFFITGIAGLMIDRLVYKDFRKKKHLHKS